MPQRLLGFFDETGIPIDPAQRAGPDNPNLVGVHVANALAETAQALQRDALALLAEYVVFIESGGEAHHFAQAIDHRRLPVRQPRDDHVKAVGAEVDRGEDFGFVVGRSGEKTH